MGEHDQAAGVTLPAFKRPGVEIDARASAAEYAAACFWCAGERHSSFANHHWHSAAEAEATFAALRGTTLVEFDSGPVMGALFARDDSVALVTHSKESARWTLMVAGQSRSCAEQWRCDLDRLLPPVPAGGDGTFPVRFWNLEAHGPSAELRRLPAANWPSVRSNYATKVQPVLDALHQLDRPAAAGKLLILHGPPGVGKSHLIRSLLSSWSPWCSGEIVLDPEKIFEHVSYLREVVHDADDLSRSNHSRRRRLPAASSGRWKALVIEDADEYLYADAKVRTGQGVARLLNLADGLLGHGQPILVVVTTNVSRGDLHAALTRPGRSIGTIALDALSPDEGTAWLARHGKELALRSPATLAELYEAVNPQQLHVDPTRVPVAGYA